MELTNELTVIISMFAMVISMFAILAGFIIVVWRGQAAINRHIDEQFRVFRTEIRQEFEEFRTETRQESKEFRTEIRQEFRVFRTETRQESKEFRTETRNNFNTTNQNIEKVAEQVGSQAERVATVEGYISAVSDR